MYKYFLLVNIFNYYQELPTKKCILKNINYFDEKTLRAKLTSVIEYFNNYYLEKQLQYH